MRRHNKAFEVLHRSFISWIFISLLLVASIPTACRSDNAREEDDVDAGRLISKIESVQKLTLARMTVKKTASIDDLRLEDAKGARQIAAAISDALKIGDRKAVYSYDTYLIAWIDPREIQPSDISVNHQERRISISLPKIHTSVAGREPEFHEDHYRVTGLRSQISPAERAALKESMNTQLKNEVENDPAFTAVLSDWGRRRAESFFRQLLATDGYTVDVFWKENGPALINPEINLGK